MLKVQLQSAAALTRCLPVQARIAVVGKATGRVLANRSALLRVDFVPSKVSSYNSKLPFSQPEKVSLCPACDFQ